MVEKIEANNTPEELKEREQLYYDNLNTDNLPKVKIPSLKYALYNYKISKVFRAKINEIKADVILLKNKLEGYKGNKINILEKNKQLNEINERLAFIEKEDLDDYTFYKEYLVTAAKRRDVINNDIAKKVYVKSSEEIIRARIKKFMKYEKNFLIYNDNILQLKTFFNM